MGTVVLARRNGVFCGALVLGAFVLLLWTSSARADFEFCPTGSGAGQCAAPEGLNSLRGLALDYESGHLYVADRGNNRVDVFEENGSFLFSFGSALLSKPTKVAVDNDPASPTHHFVYVLDSGHSRVARFDATGKDEGEVPVSGSDIGVGKEGVLYVLDNAAGKQRLRRYKPNGEPITPPPPAECVLAENQGTAISLAVNHTTGEFWVAREGGGEGVRKYDADCTELFAAEGSVGMESNLVALDEAGNPFAAQSETRDKAIGSFRVLTAYDPATGAILSRYGYGRIPSVFRPEGLALRNSGGVGGVFLAMREEGNTKRIRRIDYPPPPPALPSPGPIAAPPSLEVPISKVGSAKATLVAEVNPEGKATEVHVEYLTQAAYEAQGNSFTGPATKSTAPQSLGATGFKLKTAEALAGCPDPESEAAIPGKCLDPETKYRWRVVAENADGSGEGTVEGPPFETGKSIDLGEVWATRPGTDTARLNAEVNPHSIPATGFFEYVDDAAYQRDIEEGGDGFAAAAEAPDVGAGQAPLDFGAGEALTARGVVVYPLKPGTLYHYRLVADDPLIDPVKSEPAKELRTFATPAIDPCPNDASRVGPGAFLPDCRAYEMVSPPDKEGGDISVLNNSVQQLAVLEQASTSGERLAYGSVRSFGEAASAPYTSQYVARRVAGEEWQTHSINPPRGRPIFTVLSQTDTEFKAFSDDLCDAWLTSFAEFPAPTPPGYLSGYSNLLRRSDGLCVEDGGARFEALAPISVPVSAPGKNFFIEPLGASTDGGHMAFVATDKISPEGSAGLEQLYESVGGAGLRFVCVLPGGGAVSGSCTAGSRTAGGHAGTQIGRISENGSRIFWSTPGRGEGKIYVRIDGTQTTPVSEEGEALSGTSKSWFWGAAADGSKAVFSTEVEPGASDLYEFDVDGEETHPIAEGVVGVMGISENAKRIYFASRKVLSGEEANGNGDKALAGKANLYLHEAGEASGSARFVTTLAGADLTQAVSSEPYFKRTSQVSPDGRHVAFVSAASLTGYDNKGADSGTPIEEVYRYSAAGGELSCVSCNPSGARPAGRAWLPPWESGMHAARVLSDDGSRLYYESADVLAARDSNGRVDVYQWEEPGTGGCDEADASFSPDAGGCVDLVSSGQGPQDSRFVESDPAGKNVFFATVSSLLPQDAGVVDIYDARVEGGLPVPPIPPPPCEGDACHAQIRAPEEPAPASEGYAPPPEAPTVRKPSKGRCAKGKRRVSAKGKSRCVAKHKRGRSAR